MPGNAPCCIVIIAWDRYFLVVAQIILALIRYAVAAFVTADGKLYVATTEINNAVGGTFLWVRSPTKPLLALQTLSCSLDCVDANS